MSYFDPNKGKPKLDYYQKSCDILQLLTTSGKHPSLLLHACCAPCSSFPLEFLANHFTITIYYNNSNIYPSDEFHRRLEELKRYLEMFNQDRIEPVQLVVPPYQNEQYTKKLSLLQNQGEGSGRCFYCYAMRMSEAYHYAAEQEFDYFTTVMTISRQKNSQKLNQIGLSLSRLYPQVSYFFSDFKKKQGIDRTQQLSKEHNLYRQDYCGCLYSWQEKQTRKKQ